MDAEEKPAAAPAAQPQVLAMEDHHDAVAAAAPAVDRVATPAAAALDLPQDEALAALDDDVMLDYLRLNAPALTEEIESMMIHDRQHEPGWADLAQTGLNALSREQFDAFGELLRDTQRNRPHLAGYINDHHHNIIGHLVNQMNEDAARLFAR